MRIALLILIAACSDSSSAAAPEVPPPEPVRPKRCPDDMAFVDFSNACVDRYEASLREGRAFSVGGVLPAESISWHDALAACEAADKRLCTVAEWEGACRGPEERVYPYGEEYEAGRCNTGEERMPPDQMHLRETGSRAQCQTPEGIYDLSGNVHEWRADPDPTGVLRSTGGGSFSVPNNEVVCVRRSPTYLAPETSLTGVGFRCCRDPS